MKSKQLLIQITAAWLALGCFALSPTALAVTPAGDGGYPNQNTVEDEHALFSFTTSADNTANGFEMMLKSNTTGSDTVSAQAGSLSADRFSSEPEAVTFTDVSAEAGVDENNCSWGAAWADYDGDGNVDIMTVGHLTRPNVSICQVWHNNGDGTFTDVTSQAGLAHLGGDAHGPCWADFDGDGKLDLYVAKGTDKSRPINRNELWRNNGDGTFTNIAASSGVQGIGARNRGAYAVDYNGDGLLDIFTPSFFRIESAEPNLLFRNDGGFQFTEVAEQAGIAREGIENRTSAWADFDGDGLIDVFIAKVGVLYKNLGDGTFADVTAAAGITTSEFAQCGAWGDYDYDGYPDLYVTMADADEASAAMQGILYHNNGDGTFTDVTLTSGAINRASALGVTWGDYDNDGNLDLYIVNTDRANTPNRLFRNNGNGTFSDRASAAGVEAKKGGRGSDATFVDYNNDGFLDLFVCNGAGATYGPYILYRNEGNGNNWLEVALTGQQSNRDGIGAKLILTAEHRTQFREYTEQHYMAQNHIPVHFGLPHATIVDSLTIKWPSGITQTLTNIPINQLITVTEPASP